MGRYDFSGSDEWEILAAAAQKGDKLAYTRLLKAISLYVPKVLGATLAESSWIDDITQDVLMSVHKSLKTYSPERPFKPWLRAIISFRRADYLRRYYAARKNGQVDLEDPEFQSVHVTVPDFAGELKDIEAQLEKLSGKQRQIFEMMRIYGYSAQEVAEEMGMSVSAVKVSVHRAQNKMQKN